MSRILKTISIIAFFIFVNSALFAQSGKWGGMYDKIKHYSNKSDIKNMTANGCTMSPDGISWLNIDWSWACDQHDRDYNNLDMSQTEADRRLYQNMIKAGAPKFIAQEYYDFVSDLGYLFWEPAQERAKRVRDAEIEKRSCPTQDDN